MTWLDTQAEGIALALILAVLGLLALLGAVFIERLVEPDRDRGIERTAERRRSIDERGRRTRAGMR